MVPTITATLRSDNVTYDLDIVIPNDTTITSSPTLNIRGYANYGFGNITVTNQIGGAHPVLVSIRGCDVGGSIGYIGSFVAKVSQANAVWLTELSVTGNVGDDRTGAAAISADVVSGLNIGGDVTGDIAITDNSTTLSGTVGGKLVGNITGLGPAQGFLGSKIGTFTVGGAITGANGSLSSISVPGGIQQLTAGSINANISTLDHGGYGTVNQINTTTGSFTGYLYANKIAPAFNNPTSGISTFGDLNAFIVAYADISVPISVGGNFTATHLDGANQYSNIIQSTYAFFDTNSGASGTLQITGDAQGAIQFGSPQTSGLKSINRDVVIHGALSGSISLSDSVGGNITISGATTGKVNIAGSVGSGYSLNLNGGLSSSGQVNIGGTLAGSIVLPPLGLQGQIIINQAGGTGTWPGTIQVDGTTLAPTNIGIYATLSSVLGGGSVGLAPFQLYQVDCKPQFGMTAYGQGVVETAFTPKNSPSSYPIGVTLRHFGPIMLNPGINPDTGAHYTWADAVTFECEPINTPGYSYNCSNWMAVSGLFRVFGPGSTKPDGSLWTDSNGIGFARVTGTIPRAGLYHAILNPSAVLCANVTGNPSVVWPGACSVSGQMDVVFRIAPDCDGDGADDETQLHPPSCSSNCAIADFNCDGHVTVQDLFDFLGAWFGHCMGQTGSPCNGLNADVNHSGAVSVQDIFDFLGDWFGCGG